MKYVMINIPENLNLNEQETKQFLAAKMHEAGKFPPDQAAELAGLSKVAFSGIPADFNVSLINYSPIRYH